MGGSVIYSPSTHIGYGVLLLFAFALTFLYPSFRNRADNLHKCRVGYSCFIHARQKLMYHTLGVNPTEYNHIADTARYRAIGNSICVYCAERLYIGIIRILQEEEKDNERKDESLL